MFLFGAHQFLWKQHWTDEDVIILEEAFSLGLTVFEISLIDDVSFNYALVGNRADRLGIELSVGPGNEWPMECDISHDDSRFRQKGLRWHKDILDKAAELGAKSYCGAIYSHPGRVCRRPPPSDEISRAAENLFVLAEYANTLGIALVIEPMSRFRNHLVNTASQAFNLLMVAGHPNLYINLDTYHMITEERNYGSAIRCASSRLWGIHACENDRGIPGGGLVPWEQVVIALQERAGTIRILLETYRTGPQGFGESRGIFQNLCPDPVEFISKGLQFLKNQIADQNGS